VIAPKIFDVLDACEGVLQAARYFRRLEVDWKDVSLALTGQQHFLDDVLGGHRRLGDQQQQYLGFRKRIDDFFAPHGGAIDVALDAAFGRALETPNDQVINLGWAELKELRPRGREPGPRAEHEDVIAWSSNTAFHGRMPLTLARESGWYRVTLRVAAVMTSLGVRPAFTMLSISICELHP